MSWRRFPPRWRGSGVDSRALPVRALARVNVAAIERNCARLASELRGGAALCAVVKADGYGHGAVPAARAALAGARLLVMGALSAEELDTALAADADVVAWREAFVTVLSARGEPARV